MRRPGMPRINLPVYSDLSDVSSGTLKPGANIFPSLLEVVTRLKRYRFPQSACLRAEPPRLPAVGVIVQRFEPLDATNESRSLAGF